MQKSQLQQLRDHLNAGRSITPLEAIGVYGMFRLAARIKELRYQGWDIKSEIKRDRNGKQYAEYSLDHEGGLKRALGVA